MFGEAGGVRGAEEAIGDSDLIVYVCRAVARRWKGLTAEELVGYAWEQVERLHATHQPAKGPWPPYARRMLFLRLHGHARELTGKAHGGLVSTLVREESSLEVREACQKALGRLDSYTQHLFRAHYMNGETMDSLGRQVGVSRQAIHQRLKRAMEELRFNMEEGR